MSRRRNHATMGLAFILGCLVIAFAIYLGLKTAPHGTVTNEVATATTNSAEPSAAASDDHSHDVDWWTTAGLDAFKFTAYPASTFAGPKVPPSFTGAGRNYSDFRTRIKEGAASGPNFAGHFTVVTIGCGAECTWSAIVDNSNGRIQSFEIGGHGSGEDSTTADTKFEVDSNLLKEVASDPADEHGCIYSAYLWTGTSLRLIGRQKAQLPNGETSELQGCATTSSANATNADAGSDQAANASSPSSPTPAPTVATAPGNSSDDMQASNLPHEAFVHDCIEKDGDAFNGIDTSDKPPLCECIYNRLQNYGRLTAENGGLALNMCKLQLASDRGRFERDYAPTGTSAQGTDGTDKGQPQ
jgi:hypothetical protein